MVVGLEGLFVVWYYIVMFLGEAYIRFSFFLLYGVGFKVRVFVLGFLVASLGRD